MKFRWSGLSDTNSTAAIVTGIIENRRDLGTDSGVKQTACQELGQQGLDRRANDQSVRSSQGIVDPRVGCNAQQVINRGRHVGRVMGLAGRVSGRFVRGPVNRAGVDASAGQYQ